MRMFLRGLVLASAAVLAGGFAALPAGGPQRIAFQIATGSAAGTYYPIGVMLAALISHPPGITRCEAAERCGPEGLIAAARASEGSIANVRAVNEGRVASGLAQADIAAEAAAGKGVFKAEGALTRLTAIAALYPETVHLIVAAGGSVKAVKDLRNKRVSIDSAGSGTNATARAVLSAFKLTEKRVKLSFENAEKSMELLLAGELDAFFFVGGAPLGIAEEQARAGKLRLIPLEGPEIDALLKSAPYLTKAEIPDGVYAGVPATAAIEVRAVWLVNADTPEDLVYAIARALFHPDNRALLDSGHPKGRLIRLETAQTGLPVPLHPGAARYYASIAAPN